MKKRSVELDDLFQRATERLRCAHLVEDRARLDRSSKRERRPIQDTGRPFGNTTDIVIDIGKLGDVDTDDLREPRPGRQAAKEWGVRSPLVEAGFTKEDVRQASRLLGLTTWDKPSMACLASRIPTGTPVTFQRLSRIERCEAGLKELGLKQVRARHLEEAVRLELEESVFERMADPVFQSQVVRICRETGYEQVLLDLSGYGKS